jgi:hypothetical protein
MVLLQNLKRAYRMCQYAPEPTEPSLKKKHLQFDYQSDSRTSIMVARCQNLREWHRELSHLIDGFRNEMVEF